MAPQNASAVKPKGARMLGGIRNGWAKRGFYE
jgi:hypothetical protein